MDLTKLGNKSGIAGIILAALGLGGGTAGDFLLSQSSQPPPAHVSYGERRANETLLAAVENLGRLLEEPRAVTEERIGEARKIVREAKETARTSLGRAKEELAGTREEIRATVRESLREVGVKAVSGLAGVVGIFLSAAGFRDGGSSASRRDAASPTEEGV